MNLPTRSIAPQAPAGTFGQPGGAGAPGFSMRQRIAFGGLLLLLVAVPIAQWLNYPFAVSFLTRFAIYALAAVSLDLVLGYGALVSFGHAMFFALGGYVVGISAFHVTDAEPLFGWLGSNSALIVWPVAMLACGLLGALVGMLALRTSGVQFIMITLAFGQMVYFLLVSLQAYGGDDGLLMKRPNTLPGVNLANPIVMYYVCVAALVLWTAFCMRLVDSHFGMVLRALRQSERRAINLGVAPHSHRLLAFIISAMGTGLAGVLWANYALLVTPDMASWAKSGEFMAVVILGGVGTLLGPIAGALVFTGLEQVMSALTEHWMLIVGPILVLVAVYGRSGLLGALLKERHV